MATQTVTLDWLKVWYSKYSWGWKGGRRQEPLKLDQARTVPLWDHSLAVCLRCSYCKPVRGLMQSVLQTAPWQHWCWYPPLYRLGSRALRAWSNASKSMWQGVSTAKSKSQEPAVSTVSLLHSHGYTLLKLVNSLVVSAGTWKHKWRWKSISWKVETNFSGLTTEPVCVPGDLLPLQQFHYWLMVCYRSQLSFIVRKIPICLVFACSWQC